MQPSQRLAVVSGLFAVVCLLSAWQLVRSTQAALLPMPYPAVPALVGPEDEDTATPTGSPTPTLSPTATNTPRPTATARPPQITYVDPPNTLASSHITPNIIVGGSHLQTGASVSFGQVLATCNFDTPAQLICTAPANATVGRVTVTLTNPDNQSSVLVDGFTYTGVLNESDAGGEADYCTLQPPTEFNAESDRATRKLYGFVAEPGYTDNNQPPERIRAEAGYGPLQSDPRTDPTYRFFTAFPNTVSLSGYRYEAAMLAPLVTSQTAFNYTYRFSLDDGLKYTYCDVNGAGSNPAQTFEPTNQGRMTIYPAGVTPVAATETPEPTTTTIVPATPTVTSTASPTLTATDNPTTSPTTSPTTTAIEEQVVTPTASRVPLLTVTATTGISSTPTISSTVVGTAVTLPSTQPTITSTPTRGAAIVHLPFIRR